MLPNLRPTRPLAYLAYLLVALYSASAFSAEPATQTTDPNIQHQICVALRSHNMAMAVTTNGLPTYTQDDGDYCNLNGLANPNILKGLNTLVIRWRVHPNAKNVSKEVNLSVKVVDRYVNRATGAIVKETVLANVANEVPAPADKPGDRDTDLVVQFQVNDHPITELPWLQGDGEPITEQDRQAIHQLAMNMVRAYQQKDGESIRKLYHPLAVRAAVSTGMEVSGYEKQTQERILEWLRDPKYALTPVNDGDIGISQVGKLNLVKITGPNGGSLIKFKMSEGTFYSDTYVSRVGNEWIIVH